MATAILIDGNSLMYRAYYATNYGEIMRNSKGVATNCVYAFFKMIQKLKIDSYDYTLIAFDYGKKTLRHEKLESYKGGRAPMPDELRAQVPFVKELSKSLGLKVYEQELIEADDIVGTMAHKLNLLGVKVNIYSGDKDLLQLVNDKTSVYLTKRGVSDLVEYNVQNFKDLHGILPNQVPDLKGLMGDTSDNLKGVEGIGPKRALDLINKYGSLEAIIEHVSELTPSMRKNIERDYEQGLLCKELATIDLNSNIALEVEDLRFLGPDNDKVYELFTELEFNSVIGSIKKSNEPVSFEVLQKADLKILKTFEHSNFVFEYFDDNYHTATILGLAINHKNKNYFIETKDLDSAYVKHYLLENQKDTYDLKAGIVIASRLGLEIKEVRFDLMLLAYLINSDTKDNIEDLCQMYEVDLTSQSEVYGKGVKRAIPSSEVYQKYAASKVSALAELFPKLKARWDDDCLENYKLEHRLSYTLARVEMKGMYFNQKIAEDLRVQFLARISELKEKIFLRCGFEFNINSPKQLGDVLFNKLNLPYPKRHKEGESYSTSVEILEKISADEVVGQVLEYRRLTKLISSFIDSYEQAVMADGRLRTIYRQALTATGRLSSTDPNVQNIPIRTEEGRSIRKIFTTDKIFIGLDYSQIELRVLAHLSEDEVMIEAFNKGEDIHRLTASKVYNKPLEEVTREERSIAKAVNFGIIYGQSAYGLAEELKISIASAKDFINEYYNHYPKIKAYLDSLASVAKERGYSLTMTNRRRYLKDLSSSSNFQREIAERTALNSPIQGSAADIIKLAMVNLDEALVNNGLKSRIILQVHDELILEVEKDELAVVSNLAKYMMEHAYKLRVPLIADYNEADNLYDLK